MFLKQASICINCEWIGENLTHCEKCGSTDLMSLGRWFVSINQPYRFIGIDKDFSVATPLQKP